MPCSVAPDPSCDAERRVTYLSDEWIEALDVALETALENALETARETARENALEKGPGGDRLVVQYRVEGGPGGPRSWHLDLGPDRLRARAGEAPDAAVTFTQPWPVAAAIAAGRRSATEALLTGDIAVGGDASVLLPWRAALRRAGDALAALSAATDVPHDEEG